MVVAVVVAVVTVAGRGADTVSTCGNPLRPSLPSLLPLRQDLPPHTPKGELHSRREQAKTNTACAAFAQDLSLGEVLVVGRAYFAQAPSTRMLAGGPADGTGVMHGGHSRQRFWLLFGVVCPCPPGHYCNP